MVSIEGAEKYSRVACRDHGHVCFSRHHHIRYSSFLSNDSKHLTRCVLIVLVAQGLEHCRCKPVLESLNLFEGFVHNFITFTCYYWICLFAYVPAWM